MRNVQYSAHKHTHFHGFPSHMINEKLMFEGFSNTIIIITKAL